MCTIHNNLMYCATVKTSRTTVVTAHEFVKYVDVITPEAIQSSSEKSLTVSSHSEKVHQSEC